MKILVGPSGLEPPTSCLSGTRSNLLSYEPMWLVSKWSLSLGLRSEISGGDEEIRTLDPLLAGQVLSQLSYTPIIRKSNLTFYIKSAFCLGLDLLIFLRYPGRLLSPRCQHWAIFPCGRPQSIFTTAELNFRVRNGNGWTLCVYNTDFSLIQRTFPCSLKIEQQIPFFFISSIVYAIPRLKDNTFSIERRWSSRTFRYGYLVTT